MQLPSFSERNHPLIKPLLNYGDRELLQFWQAYPDRGQYFTALYCRYGALVYGLLTNCAVPTLQIDYLFARTWRQIFQELQLRLTTEELPPDPSLQNWVLNQTAGSIHQKEIPAIEHIHYCLSEAPPPLWCYLEVALAQLAALDRLILLMAQTFRWSESRIVAYLQSEGEAIELAEVQTRLSHGYQVLQEALPADIRDIYLDRVVSPV